MSSSSISICVLPGHCFEDIGPFRVFQRRTMKTTHSERVRFLSFGRRQSILEASASNISFSFSAVKVSLCMFIYSKGNSNGWSLR